MGYRKYSSEIKLECIHLNKEEHLSPYEIARRMGIEAETNVRRWLELYDEHGEEWFLKEQRGPKRQILLITNKNEILSKLDKVSINNASLFPEIENISKYIKNKYS